jgi:hypothetical protein
VRLVRTGLGLAGLAACALVLGGCVVFKGITVGQTDPGAPIRFVVVLCANENEAPIDHPGCQFASNSGDTDEDAGSVQLLLAVQVPAGTGAPPTLTGTEPEPGKPITFTRSASYEAELNKFAPPAEGREWIGWISEVYDHTTGPNGTEARQTSIEVSLELPRGPDGGPFPGTFDYRWVVGGRTANSEFLPSRPVECGEFLYGGGAPFGTHTCVDDPTRALVEGAPDTFASRDFVVTAQPAAANPGATATVPFRLRTAGPIGTGPNASLSASTTLPGVQVGPQPGSAALTSGMDLPVTVPVAIPAGADPGDYEVSVTAAIPGGVTRTGTATLTVNDTRDPVARQVSVRPRRFKPSAPAVIAAAGARVSYRLSEPATVGFTVRRCRGKRCRRKLRGRFSDGGQAGLNTLRFSGFLRNKPLRRGRYALVATPTDVAGNRGKAVRAKFAIRR